MTGDPSPVRGFRHSRALGPGQSASHFFVRMPIFQWRERLVFSFQNLPLPYTCEHIRFWKFKRSVCWLISRPGIRRPPPEVYGQQTSRHAIGDLPSTGSRKSLKLTTEVEERRDGKRESQISALSSWKIFLLDHRQATASNFSRTSDQFISRYSPGPNQIQSILTGLSIQLNIHSPNYKPTDLSRLILVPATVSYLQIESISTLLFTKADISSA